MKGYHLNNNLFGRSNRVPDATKLAASVINAAFCTGSDNAGETTDKVGKEEGANENPAGEQPEELSDDADKTEHKGTTYFK